MLPDFAYSRPTSMSQAIEQLASRGSVVHAGGTDLLGCLRDGALDAAKVVSLSGIAELRGIAPLRDGRLRIGALTTLAEITADPLIAERYAVLAQAATSVASPQLRNQGTLGGNLCQRPRCWYFRGDFPCLRKGGDRCYAFSGENEFHCIFGGAGCYMVHPSDTAPALVALDAQARLVGPEGARTVPLESFFVLPAQQMRKENVLQANEILTEIFLPPPAPNSRSSYRKVRTRAAWDFALAGVALALTLAGGRVETARIVLSGVAPIPWRAADAEKILAGKRLNTATASQVAAAAVRGAEPLSQNAYKVDLVRGIVEEALLATM